MTNRGEAVARAARRLAEGGAGLGARVRAAAVEECALSPAMADRVWAVACARYTPEGVRALAGDARRGQRVGVVLAATVATAPLRAVALPWLAGAERVWVRPSRRQRALVATVVEAFGSERVACVDALPADVEAVIAYGRDETLAAIARGLPEGVAFEGRGHGFGVAYVGDGADVEGAARAVAMDVALHDQRGCLSPQAVFVRGDAVAFAKALHEALGALEAELPRGRVDVGEAAAVMQWQGVVAATGRWFRRGAAHSVGALERPALVGTPGLRNVTVCGVSGVDEVRAALGAEARHVTCVGVAGDGREGEWGFTRARVVPAGTMQDPPLDGPEDPRPPAVRTGRRR